MSIRPLGLVINGDALQAILHTGSPIIIIPKSVFEQLEHSDEICDGSVDVSSKTDNKLNFIDSANLKFTMCHGEHFYNVVHNMQMTMSSLFDPPPPQN